MSTAPAYPLSLQRVPLHNGGGDGIGGSERCLLPLSQWWERGQG